MADKVEKIETKIENLDKLKKGDGVDIGNGKYEYGADLETEGVPVIDPGRGKTVSIREFEYKINPQMKRMPDNQTLFNAHAQEIKRFLWGDGLVPMEEVPPRVVVDKKNQRYKIYVGCEARLGVSWMETPKNLSVELAKGKLDKPKPS